MSILGGILLTLFSPAIISRMEDGVFKIVVTFLIPFIGYKFISVNFGIFLLGVCLPFGLGSPMRQNEIVTTSGIRRAFGGAFDFIGIVLVIISIFMFIFD